MKRFVSLLLFSAACGGTPAPENGDMPLQADMATQGDMALPPASQGIGANDVSVLFPLPSSDAELAALLPLSAAAAGGPLLSTDQFAQLVPDQDSQTRNYGDFRVIAARIDPCFPTLANLTSNPSACHRQLRLIAQPIVMGGIDDTSAAYGALDSAVHLLYDLDADAFRALSKSWLALATKTTGNRALALGVHPTIKAEGLTGPTASAFTALIVKYAGSASLYRVTAMDGRFAVWESAGMNAGPTQLVPIQIATLPSSSATTNGALEQLQTDPTNNGPFEANALSTTLTSLQPLGGTAVPNSGTTGAHVEFDASSSSMKAAMQLSLQVDDPTGTFNADTLDCTSCHVAGRAREFASMNGFTFAGLNGYANTKRDLNVSPDARGRIIQQRAFGYRDFIVSINQRVVDESAAVADALEAMQ